ncbi:glycosyltransferase family 2 protein [Mycolicibacterium tusciae]|uniref:glycosyltransferase family 2 protein n=1 Tax=Mycolicibacterium tusciae TaxID=75922 RepID=UPI00024A12E3|nr:glycosyltransferase family 2 protein [Mycolicibacterium tusciae]
MIEALGISMVKNEGDVIEAFVRHNLGFMDALAIVDNDSVDDTREILVRLQQEGLPVIVFDDPLVGHFQAEIVTAVYRKVVPQFEPRFVFLLDADEFVVTSSREDLYKQLRALRPGTEAQYSWRTYIPAPTGPAGDASDPLRSIVHRKLVEDQQWWKPIVVTNPKIDSRLKVKQGNHGVTYAGRSLRKVKLRDVAIAHFPVRSVDQFTGKILVGWIANLERNRYRLDVGHAIHWKTAYQRIVRGPALTSDDLTQEALRYAQLSDKKYEWPRDVTRDPVEPTYTKLTVGRLTGSGPLQKVVRSIDRIFNPENDISGPASSTEFLWNAGRRPRKQRKFVLPFKHYGGPESGLYMDLPPFRYLAERDRPLSVMDIGCGAGQYLKYFAANGSQRVIGVGGIEREKTYLDVEEYVNADLRDPLELAEAFDVVMSLGVAQDIPAGAESRFVSSIVRHAHNRIVFCSVGQGHPEDEQINNRSVSYWLELFASAGWHPCVFDSLAMRSLSTFPWLSSNLVVLAPGVTNAAAPERLREGGSPTKWRKRQPAAITHPFTDLESKLSARRDSRLLLATNARLRALMSRVRD